ncbi:lysoplasmalogenase [Leptospira borgpetersenii]|uniref:lysoplasmalogenase n=1 Tax=Leptospira borgpetersenii TaxID=174 RepID=UPI000A8F070D|nr:lysoplasmalogenase [Leptospira borgpetersenii]
MIPLLFSIASITHLLVLYFVPDEVVFKLGSKILPILILIFLYFFRGNWKDKAGRFIFAGLIFSLFGDSFLALPGNYFVFGLGSFLMAQILYSIGFSIGNPVHLIRSIPFFAFGIFFYAWIFSGIEVSLYVPVAVYIVAICTKDYSQNYQSLLETELNGLDQSGSGQGTFFWDEQAEEVAKAESKSEKTPTSKKPKAVAKPAASTPVAKTSTTKTITSPKPATTAKSVVTTSAKKATPKKKAASKSAVKKAAPKKKVTTKKALTKPRKAVKKSAAKKVSPKKSTPKKKSAAKAKKKR